jgi:hypothetical protein
MRRLATAVLLGLVLGAAPVPGTASATAPPRLGTWEGKGSRGVHVSFRLIRSGGRVAVANGMTITLPTLPVLCPAGPLTAAAVHYRRVTYSGPGSPPIAIFHYRPREFTFDVFDDGLAAVYSGRLRNRRTMLLTAPAPARQPRGCGWPRKKLRWVVHRARRVRVADGTWSGTLDNGGTVELHVSAGGSIVDAFQADVACVGAGPGPGAEVGSQEAEEFVDRRGNFAGPIGRQTTNGVRTSWTGRFAGEGTLTGTVTTWAPCAMPGGGRVDAAFSAHRSGP